MDRAFDRSVSCTEPSSRTVASAPTNALGKGLDSLESGALEPLDDQLGDPVAAPEHDLLDRVVVDQQDLDLAAVPRIDRSRGVHDRQPVPRCQARTGVDESDVAVGQRDRDPGRDERPLPRGERHVDGAQQIGPGIPGVGIAGQRQAGIELLDRDQEVGRVIGSGDVIVGHGETLTITLGHAGGIILGVSDTARTTYHERLRVPLRWWAQGTMLVATLWLTLIVALVEHAPWVAWLATGLAMAGLVAFLRGYGDARVVVGEDWFRAGRARIEAAHVGTAEPLDAEETRRVAGRDADARAYLLLRPYLKRSVKVQINDPADPAPYWLVSSRHPDALAGALNALVRPGQ